jgi:Animal haem peroxidase
MSQARIRHGSETFFIEGEGLLTTQVGGRSGEEPDPLSESQSARVAAPRALAADAAPPFRFSRVGPKGTGLPATVTKKLARAMTVGGGGHGDVPAGYTYLGQFVDHDLTMDRTAVMLGTDVRPVDLVQGRSPRLDLDSLYGNGPGDSASARFYSDGLHLKTGDTVAAGDPKKVGHDLPRVGKGSNQAARRRADIPDLRNDENLVVAQTHLAMIHFHNRVVDKLPASTPATEKFGRARKQVSMHYQWLVRHDYLPRIVRPAVLDDVWAHGRKLVEPAAAPTSVPTMPVEFSVAAFRLGHSMIRSAYNWNKNFAGSGGTLDLLFLFSATSGDLGGDPRLPSNWIADWRRMYDFPAGGRPGLAAPGGNVNRAMRIDTLLTDPLKDLPLGAFGGGPSIPDGDLRRNLAFRNLTRAKMVRLASGQQMTARLRSRGVDVKPLTRSQVLEGNGGARLDHLTSAEKDAVAARTPLWFYVLREAELNGGRLKGMGARIVAETFHRAMEGSRFSIVRDPAWRPTLGRDAQTFEMTDLLFFAFAGKKSEINPLG